ncbi:MAG TPA: hypothetical protein PKX93_09400 [bacterium]|nr:hypothetical protein [bacterium]HPP12472.1 hypothetical protein [bacterium]
MKNSILLAALLLLAGCATTGKVAVKNDFFLDEGFRENYLKQRPELPETIKQAVREARIVPGMSTAMVEELLGPPAKKYLSETDWMEVWFYPRLSVGFNNKREVVSVVEETSLRRAPEALDREIRVRREKALQQEREQAAAVLARRVWSLAFVVETPEQPGQVWVVGSDGKGLRKVADLAEYITWAFDEKTLAGVVLQKKEDGTSQEQFALWDVSTGQGNFLPVESEGGFLQWLADRKLLAVHPGQGRRIIFVDREGNQRGSQILSGQSNLPLQWPVWSPDGSAVAFYERKGPVPQLVVRETAGERVLFTLEAVEPVPVVWSPDSRQLLATRLTGLPAGEKRKTPVVSDESEENRTSISQERWLKLKRELVVVDVSSGQVRSTGIRGKAGQFNYSQGAWSPDGSCFVLAVATRGQKESIYRRETSGRLVQIADLPPAVSCQEVVFRPDGAAIAFVLNGQTVWSSSPEGKNRTLLVEVKEGFIRQLCWAPWASPGQVAPEK